MIIKGQMKSHTFVNRSVVSMIHIRLCLLQLKSGGKKFFCVPKALLFSLSLDQTDKFFALFWCLFVSISFILLLFQSIPVYWGEKRKILPFPAPANCQSYQSPGILGEEVTIQWRGVWLQNDICTQLRLGWSQWSPTGLIIIHAQKLSENAMNLTAAFVFVKRRK